MLKQLSRRNARRQVREYALYFITLTCTVSFLYAFNALLFSDSVKSLLIYNNKSLVWNEQGLSEQG